MSKGYKARHHKVTGTIVCEFEVPDKTRYIQVRLLVTPNVKQSYICKDSLESDNWSIKNNHVALQLEVWRSLPWKPKFRDKTSSLDFEIADKSHFSSVEKRELPESLRVQLAVQAHIADPELLWPHDKELPIHGTLGYDSLILLHDIKKMNLEPGLRI